MIEELPLLPECCNPSVVCYSNEAAGPEVQILKVELYQER